MQFLLPQQRTVCETQPPRIESSVSVVLDKIFPFGYKCPPLSYSNKGSCSKTGEKSSRLSSAVLSDALKTSICQMLDDAFEYYLLIEMLGGFFVAVEQYLIQYVAHLLHLQGGMCSITLYLFSFPEMTVPGA